MRQGDRKLASKRERERFRIKKSFKINEFVELLVDNVTNVVKNRNIPDHIPPKKKLNL